MTNIEEIDYANATLHAHKLTTSPSTYKFVKILADKSLTNKPTTQQDLEPQAVLVRQLSAGQFEVLSLKGDPAYWAVLRKNAGITSIMQRHNWLENQSTTFEQMKTAARKLADLNPVIPDDNILAEKATERLERAQTAFDQAYAAIDTAVDKIAAAKTLISAQSVLENAQRSKSTISTASALNKHRQRILSQVRDAMAAGERFLASVRLQQSFDSAHLREYESVLNQLKEALV
jgi:hypothetical protein